MDTNRYLVMYDIREIQNFIYRTAKVKDAIGASALVEGIIEETLDNAVKKIKEENPNKDLRCELEWHFKTEPKQYTFAEDDQEASDVEVLYIGGGNAYVLIKGKELAKEINQLMAFDTMKKTYSLQLAIAMVPLTGNYHDDYKKLMRKMDQTKADMIASKPIGALPIEQIEAKTGYSISDNKEDENKNTLKAYTKEEHKESRETYLKRQAEEHKRKDWKSKERQFNNYTTQKGKDSTIAVVHIDGNNMGLRIRDLIQDETDYGKAVNLMREISCNIQNSFETAFDKMQIFFNENAGKYETFQYKDNFECFVLKILTAGDDITYVCNGKVALATVEYFCKEITKSQKYSLISEETLKQRKIDKSLEYFAFSVCAGIAYVGSHFPFSVAYDVAEACCESAKKVAKRKNCATKNGYVENWVDFAICKNIQARNLEQMREREYVINSKINSNINLLQRPYCVVGKDAEPDQKLQDFTNKIRKIWNPEKGKEILTRSQVKTLRNVYSEGREATNLYNEFLASRGKNIGDVFKGDQAVYYDATEMIDDYISLDELMGEGNNND